MTTLAVVIFIFVTDVFSAFAEPQVRPVLWPGCLLRLVQGSPDSRASYALSALRRSPSVADPQGLRIGDLPLIGNEVEITKGGQTVRGPVVGYFRDGFRLNRADTQRLFEVNLNTDDISGGSIRMTNAKWYGPLAYPSETAGYRVIRTDESEKTYAVTPTSLWDLEGWFLVARRRNRGEFVMGRIVKSQNRSLGLRLRNGALVFFNSDDALVDVWVTKMNANLRDELQIFWGLSAGDILAWE